MELKDLFLVREHFKAGGKLYLAGTVLTQEEVDVIPLAKIRIGEKKVVSLDTDQDAISELAERLAIRYGVNVKANIRAALAPKVAETKATPKSNPTPGTKTPTKNTK